MKRFIKAGNAIKDYEDDWTAFLGSDTIATSVWVPVDPPWTAGTVFRVGNRVSLSGGAILDCVVAGTSGGLAPTPPSAGLTVVDGGVTWLRSFNIESSTNTSITATVWVSGGITNVEYPILNRIVTAGGRTEVDMFIFAIIQK